MLSNGTALHIAIYYIINRIKQCCVLFFDLRVCGKRRRSESSGSGSSNCIKLQQPTENAHAFLHRLPCKRWCGKRVNVCVYDIEGGNSSKHNKRRSDVTRNMRNGCTRIKQIHALECRITLAATAGLRRN